MVKKPESRKSASIKRQNYKKGRSAEMRAHSFLKKLKYKIISTNWSCPIGELDIIAEQKGVLCFIEVKYRTNRDFGTGFESVDFKKQKKLTALAKYYISSIKREYKGYRFDVVQLEGDSVDIVINAIEEPISVKCKV